ncbi:hypothetical protein SLG_20590 [Sphingobium sp. SYK-6]|uniref:DUF3089 domain-containing protein n=1 Tax=Sphingobium sp. (strain NBRC 103272 / SYK-6) TaxID=627192 RepID=UPI000227767A|nr:DUF3089 domain-containing protein [Sphingobium sp. SYK-6]BAK66734.1 hypothetical protein SLG_20590 [Sphingobium sp. SYK-6]
MARKFLYVVAFLTALAIAAMIAFSFFGPKLMQSAMVPRGGFVEPAPLPPGFYDRAEGWISRPGNRRDDPARWQPATLKMPPAAPDVVKAAVFFVHPTSSFETTRWNTPVNDPVSSAQAERFVRLQASAFAPSGEVWVPRYRQAVFGAFLTEKADAALAMERAYVDVRAAFAAFLAANPEGPVILAGHSQGSRHLLRLLNDHRADAALRARLVAAYVVGWPVSVEHDLPALGLPGCDGPERTGCMLSWQSFAQPADLSGVEAVFDRERGFDGVSRKGSAMLCTNPLNGGAAPDAPADANLGSLMGDGNAASTQLMPPGGVGARCEGRGFLILDSAPKMGSFVLPGNNYHVYDYQLFWANVRADAMRRLAAWQATR